MPVQGASKMSSRTGLWLLGMVGKRLVESGEIWDSYQQWTDRSSAAVPFCSPAKKSEAKP